MIISSRPYILLRPTWIANRKHDPLQAADGGIHWTYDIRESAEPELAYDSASASSQLDSSVGADRHLSLTRVVDDAQHQSEERSGEDIIARKISCWLLDTLSLAKGEGNIVRICEEAHAGHQDSPHMVPSERSLVDLGKGKTTTLVGILDMEEIVVEIVVGRVSTRRLVDGSCSICHGVRRSVYSSTYSCQSTVPLDVVLYIDRRLEVQMGWLICKMPSG